MRKLLIYVFIFISFLFFHSCSNENENAEIATNTFECKVDGVQKKFITSSSLTLGLIDQVIVNAYPNTEINSSENFMFNIILDESLPQSSRIGLKYFDGTKWYFSSENFISEITYRNTTTKTIKGTFSGTVEESFTSNTKQITQGSFNIKY
ncbi:hypothetical protein [Flavobacterium daejeonense]|uniref:hypothetical protein n=1 Tax=Flavobacterium daejeonense TaxID=350893 RepID=UPI00047E7233|nr:hypothetical protein [Flavobacterium daejeonense]